MVNTIRKNMVHIALTDSEKEEVVKYAKELKMSVSEYVRQSIFDKMKKSDYPNLDQKPNGFDINQVKKMMEMLSDNAEKIDNIVSKVNNITQIQDTLKALSSLINRPEMKEKELKIIELLKEHGELKPIKIIELSGLSKENVYDVISNEKIFSINVKTGRIKLND